MRLSQGAQPFTDSTQEELLSSDNDEHTRSLGEGGPVAADPRQRGGPAATARSYLTRLGLRLVDRLLGPTLAPWPHPPEQRATWAAPVILADETDEGLHQAGLAELSDDAPDPDTLAAWPALQAKLHERFTKTGAFTEPKLKAPSPPPSPTLLEGGLDGAVVPPDRDDAQRPAPKVKKAPKAASVAAGAASPEERHTRAVLALVSAEPRGAAKKAPIDPIDAADLETCRAALKAVRDAVYGVSPDDLHEWEPGMSAKTTVWLCSAPMMLNRTAEVHDALAEFDLDVHAENEALVAYANASGVRLVGLDDLDLPDDGGGEE